MQGDSAGSVAALRAAPRTEQRNPRTADIDTVPTEEVLRLLNAEDATVPGAVASALPVLATVVDKVVECVRAGGQVHYFGAGTSGRMAVLDAAEIVGAARAHLLEPDGFPVRREREAAWPAAADSGRDLGCGR